MSILIKGMEMPKGTNAMYLITPEGDVWELGDLFGDDKLIEGAKAVAVPPHGRLIDSDVLLERYGTMPFATVIVDAPTIIPADEGET